MVWNYTLFEYEKGESPGDSDGGEFYSFTFAEEDNSEFSYAINRKKPINHKG
jgi:hypothetical protein